jgi:Transposase DDE domain
MRAFRHLIREGRLTRAPAKPRRPQCTTFRGALAPFLTPAAWRQAHRAWRSRHSDCRWRPRPLVLALLVLTRTAGDSAGERFETARAFHVACHPKGKRPGKAPPGFDKALARLPAPVLRALAAAVRRELGRRLLAPLRVGGLVPVGCDGPRLGCPRSAELEGRLPPAGKRDAAPTPWLTALVLPPAGLLWAWQVGPGTAGEQAHAVRLLRALPANALFVADAGFLSHALFAALGGAGVPFLTRLSSRADLYTGRQVAPGRSRQGAAYYWPAWAQAAGLPPVKARPLRVRGGKADVWPLTDVPGRRRLGRRQAGRFYRWRWGSEGLFRAYKRTSQKMKLRGRAVRLAHREAEGPLLAVQLLLAQAAAVRGRGPGAVVVTGSPRGVLPRLRGEVTLPLGRAPGPRQQRAYLARLAAARCAARARASAKQRRPWPRRTGHKPPNPPKVRVTPAGVKALRAKVLQATQARKT